MSYERRTIFWPMGKSLPLSMFIKGRILCIALPALLTLIAWSAPALAQTGGALSITMSPGLYPAFDPNISDYVIPSGADTSLQITVNAPRNTKVSVDGQPFRKLSFTTQVSNVGEGQRFSFVVNSKTGSKTFHVRRLPSDFSLWKTDRPGVPQAEFYVFTPNLKVDFTRFRDYVVIADGYGVPLWWYHKSLDPIDAKILPDGRIAWLNFGANPPTGEARRLDGTLTQTLKPLSGRMDNHELRLLPNGNFLYIVDINRGPVDLSPYGGSPTATVTDNVIEEVTPAGTVVWKWSSMDHIPIAETIPHWWPQYLVNSSPADPFHMNAVEPDGDGYVISLRHLDAVIRIDRATGARTWKLGGTFRAGQQGQESLTFVGDTYGNFSGQHDARILPDGTLTVHDNGTLSNRAPRAVRYRLDLSARTATFLEQVTDAAALNSACCGSARKLPGGDWVTEWGQNALVTELSASGELVFRLTFDDPFFSYRAAPVPFGMVSRTDLRNGMDAQNPR